MENSSVSSRRQLRSREQKQELIQLQKRSGLSIKSFCTKHGISMATFHNWKQQLKKPASDLAGSGFAKLAIQETALPLLFAEVKGIRLYQPVSVDFLKALAS
jgi:transposase-like protein